MHQLVVLVHCVTLTEGKVLIRENTETILNSL